MKQSVNFRLNSQSITKLLLLQEVLHASKTAILERAIAFYAKNKLSKQNSIMEYAGILNEKEASSMIDVINSSKHNKELKIKW